MKASNLEERINKLELVNGELCAEINRQELLIRKLEDLILDMERDCTTCQYSCFNDAGECGIIQRIEKLAINPNRHKPKGCD